MAAAAVSDTHAVIWYLYNDRRLSAAAAAFIESTMAAGNQVVLSAISLAEVVYLVEKQRIPSDALGRLLSILGRADSGWVERPFDRSIALALTRVDRGLIPDMPDRIITATALHLGVPLITRDGKIRLSSVRTIW